MLSAPTRSGKGVGVVIPNLLNWPDSVVVLDIKGENYDVTAGYRARHGQAVYAFSPFDEEAPQPPLESAQRRPHEPAAPRRRPAFDRAGAFPERGQQHLVRGVLQRPGAQPLPRPRPVPARDARPAAHDRRDAAPVVRQGAVAEGPPERPRSPSGSRRRQATLGRMRSTRCSACSATPRTRSPASSRPSTRRSRSSPMPWSTRPPAPTTSSSRTCGAGACRSTSASRRTGWPMRGRC